MRASFLLLVFGLALVPPVAAAYGAIGYVPGTDDVPLMPGLIANQDAALVFDKPQGRIIEAQARGAVSRRAVLAFYETSLPQLGWASTGPDKFVREGELLGLAFDGRDGDLSVGFSLVPQ